MIHKLDKSREYSLNEDHKDLIYYENIFISGYPDFEIHYLEYEWEFISLNYTSGTIPSPKGIVYSHRGAYLNTIGIILAWEMKSKHVYLWTTPMFHCNSVGFPWGITAQALVFAAKV